MIININININNHFSKLPNENRPIMRHLDCITRADESPNFLSTRRCDHPKKCEFFKFLSCATSSVELLIIRNLIQYCGLRIASHHHITWEQSV
ncbi:hypothetical protein Y032_0250g157 [Ancylostoma ceylanicum]|uniref:Uncharacterized protein n=1 Tax=Ancylostoma ceylanicum TaxID=53326 RepID=A0A016SC63_9BILA|nr:hypothetical protein Y032_0250g157 [Ancylostoma ceylanicum]